MNPANLKIKFVKFYQAVQVMHQSNQISAKVVEERTVQDKNLVSIERTDFGVMICTTEHSGNKSYTEVPANNLAYINYEIVEAGAADASTQANETKATKKSNK